MLKTVTLSFLCLLFSFSQSSLWAQRTEIGKGKIFTIVTKDADSEVFTAGLGDKAVCYNQNFVPEDNGPELGLMQGKTYNTLILSKPSNRAQAYIAWEWSGDDSSTKWKETMVETKWGVTAVPTRGGLIKAGDDISLVTMPVGAGKIHLHFIISRGGEEVTKFTLVN